MEWFRRRCAAVFRLSRALWRWLWSRFKKPISWWALGFFLYGVPGHIDDGAKWFKWLSAALAAIINHVPYVPDVSVMDVASILKNDWVRGGAVVLALVLFSRGEELTEGAKAVARRLWRGAGYVMAEIADSPRRINRSDSLSLVRASRWARSRYEKSRKPRSFWNEIGLGGHIDPAEQENQRMFSAWSEIALDQFAEEEPEAVVKNADDPVLYDEKALRAWLDRRFRGDVFDQFGQI